MLLLISSYFLTLRNWLPKGISPSAVQYDNQVVSHCFCALQAQKQ